METKKRDALRSVFTREVNELKNVLKDDLKDSTDLKARLASLENRYAQLSRADEAVLNSISSDDTTFDDAKFEEELLVSGEFELVFNQMKEQLNFKINSQQVFINVVSEVPSNSDPHKLLRLKRPEIKKFGGEISGWISFWAQFSKIHEDSSLLDEDKFAFLLEALTPGSPAQKLIEGFPPSRENYVKAIELLKSRYGKEEFLIEFYVRELLSLVLKRSETTSIAQLYNDLEAQLRALDSLGVTKEKYAAIIYPLVESAVPENTFMVWERHRVSIKTSMKEPEDCLEELLAFLRIEVEGEERLKLRQEAFDNRHEKNVPPQKTRPPIKQPSASALVSTTTEPVTGTLTCIFCDKAHSSQDCVKAADMTVTQRSDIIKQKGACFRCLRKGHTSIKCRAFLKCALCKKRHFTIMCTRTEMNAPQNATVKSDQALFASSEHISTVFLQTLRAKLVCGEHEYFVRVLIDSGSQKSYILKSCIKSYNLKRQEKIVVRQELFGGHKTSLKTHGLYNIKLKALDDSCLVEFKVLDQEKICGLVPRINDLTLYEFLKSRGILLSDFGTNEAEPHDIHILLGADAWAKIITNELVKLGDDLAAVNTKLGWSVIGSSRAKSSASSAMLATLICHTELSKFWDLEVMGILDPSERKTQAEKDKDVLTFFEKTLKRDDSGRYVVCLPWIEGAPNLLDNRNIAEKRLLSTSKKLKSIKKFDDYDDVLKLWLEQGIIEKVPVEELKRPSHYIPHRAVFKDNSTTKIRPVFDASTLDADGRSLNGSMEKGPNLIEQIPLILTNFRQYSVAVTADIEKAFLQIGIEKVDRDWLRFLWWEEDHIVVFRHTRVVFGITSSPFLLGAVLAHHLNRSPQTLKETADKLSKSFYVDNCMTGVDTIEELYQFINNSQTLLNSAGFNLRGWVSNADPPKDEQNALGLRWDCKTDTLSCNYQLIDGKPSALTRRILLSYAQRLYDPIGFTAPVSVVPKIMLQKSWDKKKGWDDPLPEELTEEFKRWSEQLSQIKDCRIPRLIHLTETSSLHVFCDASKLAYASCIFVRTECLGAVKIDLLIAKSRVAPLRCITLPRLELMAALTGVRLYTFIFKSLKIKPGNITFWSDSTVVLTWIGRQHQWSVFIERRVAEIVSVTEASQWRHVPGKLNPADLLSRGCSPTQLVKTKWWEGPKWMFQPKDDWPKSNEETNMKEVLNELKKTAVTLNVSTASEFSLSQLAEKFSSYTKIVRTVERIIDFICHLCPGFSRCLKFQTNSSLDSTNSTSEKFIKAELLIFRCIQKEHFTSDHGKSALRNLNVFTDEFGLYRAKTRLLDGEDTSEFVYPIILPSKNEVVRRLIHHEHIKNGHAGTLTLMMILRQRFWIPQFRRRVNSVLQRCLICKKQRVKPLEVPVPPLPRDRTRSCPAFYTTGVDLLGPLFLDTGKKCWVIIFTCAVYRAVHLDIVTSLSSAAIIQALRRFIPRKGRPHIIHSDNGTNFVGVENALNELDWKALEEECGLQRICWKFNPPSAPWWGGYWERLVRILKDLLKKNLGRAALNLEEMITLVCECEFIMNNRPLTYVSSEASELTPLCPSMFLMSLTGSDVTDFDKIEEDHLQKRWAYLQKVREGLRVRFKKEYLGFLRSAKNRRTDVLKIGDIVLVGSEKKRLDWILAKVVELMPGRDGIVRLARLKTSTGEMLRPLQRLYPLEVDCEVHNSTTEQDELPIDVQPQIAEDFGHEDSDQDVDEEFPSPRPKTGPSHTRSGRAIKPRDVLDL